MAKSLGMIHTVNKTLKVNPTGTIDRPYLVDAPQELSEQLQRLIRSGQSFKLVGVDIGLGDDYFDLDDAGAVSGHIEYYTPTKGRIGAWKNGFNAVRTAMKLNGIRPNKLYDFRTPITNPNTVMNPNEFINMASLDGNLGAVYLEGAPVEPTDRSLFTIHNDSLAVVASTPNFNVGLGIYDTVGGDPSDFVLNEELPFTGNPMHAETSRESIPFQLSWGDGQATLSFQWRPDPALYVSILLGQFLVYVDEVQSSAKDWEFDLSIAFHIAGWKSISGGKKRVRKSKSKRRRRTKK